LYDRYHSIASNWKFSAEVLNTIRDRLNAEIAVANVMIAAAGSIGRMEASNQSDIDYIVIGQGMSDVQSIHKAAEKVVTGCGLASPKSDGVFSCGSSLSSILEGVGSADDNLGELARRMLLLLEARPIFNDDFYNDVIDAVFERYAGDVRRNRTNSLFPH
jgi:predicted nucleotidyltransferase